MLQKVKWFIYKLCRPRGAEGGESKPEVDSDEPEEKKPPRDHSEGLVSG